MALSTATITSYQSVPKNGALLSPYFMVDNNNMIDLNIPLISAAIGNGGAYLTSFNGRTGPITLISTDVTNALGYTPLANTQSAVITALTFTPMANTSSAVTTALGYTPDNPAASSITGGTINGAVIGGTTPEAGTFTTISGTASGINVIAPGTSVARTITSRTSDFGINVRDFGALGNTQQLSSYSCNIALNSTAFYVAGSNFTSQDVGKAIQISGVGINGGVLSANILAFDGSHTLTLDTAASTNLSPTLNITSAVGNGTTVTIGFATQTNTPCVVGSTIIILNVVSTGSGSGFNTGGALVTAVTNNSISFASTSTQTYVSGGTIQFTANIFWGTDDSAAFAAAANYAMSLFTAKTMYSYYLYIPAGAYYIKANQIPQFYQAPIGVKGEGLAHCQLIVDPAYQWDLFAWNNCSNQNDGNIQGNQTTASRRANSSAHISGFYVLGNLSSNYSGNGIAFYNGNTFFNISDIQFDFWYGICINTNAGYNLSASFTGVITQGSSYGQLTVTNATGTIINGASIATGAPGVQIISQVSGTTGGNGVYNVVPNLAVSSTTMTITAISPGAYLGESIIRDIRCFNCGTSTLPSIDFNSSGTNSNSTNEIICSNLQIFRPVSTGMCIRNSQTANPIGEIVIDTLRIEGVYTGQIGLQIGDPVLTGGVQQVSISNLFLNAGQVGSTGLYIVSPTGNTAAARALAQINIGVFVVNCYGTAISITAGQYINIHVMQLGLSGTSYVGLNVNNSQVTTSSGIPNFTGPNPENWNTNFVTPAYTPIFNTPLTIDGTTHGTISFDSHDGTTAGGNTIGTGAVDFQRYRSAVTQVAAAPYSVLLGGQYSTISGSANYSNILAGNTNSINSSQTYSVIVNGNTNVLSNNAYSFIGTGVSNSISGAGIGYSIIGTGNTNVISSTGSINAIVTGTSMTVSSGSTNFVGTGSSGSVSGSENAYLAGASGTISGSYNILAGHSLSITGSQSGAFGSHITISGSNSFGYGQNIIINSNNRTTRSAGYFVQQGDCQISDVQLRVITTSTTATELTCDGTSTVSSTNIFSLTLPTNKTLVKFDIRLSAIDYTTTGNWFTCDEIGAAIYSHGSGTGVFTPSAAGQIILSGGTGSSASVSFAADTTNNGLTVLFTAPNADTWHVNASISNIVEVA